MASLLKLRSVRSRQKQGRRPALLSSPGVLHRVTGRTCNRRRSRGAGALAGSGSCSSLPSPCAPQKNGEIKAPGDAPAGMCASGPWMAHVRFRHDTDVCRNRRAHTRRGGAPQRKSGPTLRTTRRALNKSQYSPRTRAPRFPKIPIKVKKPTEPYPSDRAVLITFTPSNRVVAEPCDTADTCPGCPLPSKKEPPRRKSRSSQMAVTEFQNSGVRIW